MKSGIYRRERNDGRSAVHTQRGRESTSVQIVYIVIRVRYNESTVSCVLTEVKLSERLLPVQGIHEI